MTTISKIGKYLIRRELGQGAMGIVYEGFDPVIERTVAIKTILPSKLTAADSTETLARFKRSALPILLSSNGRSTLRSAVSTGSRL